MSTRTRRSPFLAPTIALVLAACGSATSSPSASIPASPAPTHGPTAPPASVTDTPGTSPDPAGPVVGETDTGWGRIRDAVPAGFPRHPGATIADDATAEPVSAAYAVSGVGADEIAAWAQTAMEMATYSTEALSGPYEDGSYVLDSVGDGDCRIQTTIAPLGSLVLVTVRYGASCPA